MHASHDQLSAYFLWLKDRGLRFPVKAEKRAAASEPTPAPAPFAAKKALQVVFVGDTGFTDAEHALLIKMIAAMHLTGEYAIVDRLEGLPDFMADHEAELIIPLGDRAAAGCYGETMPTLHPRDLLARPDAKRVAWNDLKRAMARLNP